MILWEPLLDAPFFQELVRRTGQGQRRLCLSGLVLGARALVVSLIVAAGKRPLMMVLPDDAAVKAFRRDLSAPDLGQQFRVFMVEFRDRLAIGDERREFRVE